VVSPLFQLSDESFGRFLNLFLSTNSENFKELDRKTIKNGLIDPTFRNHLIDRSENSDGSKADHRNVKSVPGIVCRIVHHEIEKS
jgi:hypothetical protein